MKWLQACSPGFREDLWPGLSVERRARLERFAVDLLRYNRAQNLISRREPEVQLGGLLEECVVAWHCVERRLARKAGPWADVGSGAGFPGLVFAALDPDRELWLIERRQGRCDFLEREISALGLRGARAVCGDAGEWPGPVFGAVFAKAVAPPGEIEALCDPLVAPGGTLILFGRPGDAVGQGWVPDWEDPLPGRESALRGLRRG